MATKSIIIHSIQPRYDVIEDRIRLLLNHKDVANCVDMMLTRRFLLQLLPSYEEYLYRVYADEMKAATTIKIGKRKNIRLENHSRLKPYQYEAQLLSNVQFSYIAESRLTKLTLHTRDTRATVSLSYKGLTELFAVMKTAIPRYDWGISHTL